MRANRKAAPLARAALAAVLACGLMMPTGAVAAEGQCGETPPPESLEQPAAGAEQDGGFDREPDDAGAGGPAAAEDPHPGEPEPEAPVPAGPDGADPDPEAAPGASLAREVFSAAHEAATSAVEAAFASTAAAPREACPFTVTGGAAGTAAGKGDWYYDDAAGTLHIQSSKPMTISTAGQISQNIEIDAGVKADLTLDGVDIATPANGNTSPINMVTNVWDTKDKSRATHADQIIRKTMLHLTLADGSTNRLACLNRASGGAGSPGIRCGWGSVLVIDDSIRNLDQNNNIVMPEDGMVAKAVTLSNGTHLDAGSPLSAMDSKKPGTLIVDAGGNSAAIGSGPEENAGKLIFQGGNVYANGCNQGIGDNYSPDTGAAIGGGNGGSGTTMIFNGGNIIATASYHGAAIGSGWGWWKRGGQTKAKDDAITIPTYNSVPKVGEYDGYTFWNSSRGQFDTVAGDIYINGGYIEAKGAEHGNGFGSACLYTTSSNRNHVIRVTGGTLIPSSTSINKDMGGNDGYVIVTGGSVSLTKKADGKPDDNKFQGIGSTAFNTDGVETWNDVIDKGGALPENDKVFMITINLGSEIIKRNQEAGITDADDLNERIKTWTLSVGGKEYPYGAPDRFDDGNLYLWLPKSATEKEITVNLSYIDKNGVEQSIEPLFRDPSTSQNGTTLKRYINFNLPDSFKDLWKYYDGSPLTGLSISETNKIPTDDGKLLGNPDKITYKYQLYDADHNNPLGVESAASSSMPCDVGVMKLTVDSSEYSDDDSPISPDKPDMKFSDNYWGHRAIGWCEIKPTNSAVDLVKATWNVGMPDEEKDGSEQDDAGKQLTIDATISHGTHHPDGTPIDGSKCQAPRGYVQLYVDQKAVGEPMRLVFAGDPDEDGNAIPAGDPRVNASAVPAGEGSRTSFRYTFVPAEKDFLLPDATKDNRHVVSLQYLPPVKDGENPDPEPANYLESVNPADHPEKAPKAEVAVEPIDPKPTVDAEKDPENPDSDTPPPTIDTERYDPDEPDDPDGFDPYPEKPDPSMNAYTGTIQTYWDIPTEGNEHPGRIIVKVKTPSTGKLTITGEDGELYEADFVRDEEGNPVRNDDGTYSLVLDPKKLGDGKLVFQQAPNGAYIGSVWSYHVIVLPNPKIPPKTSVEKSAENLTHPNGPTQPGDRIRYTVRAANAAAGSAWNGVTITDRLPACLDIDEATIVLENPTESLKGALKTATGASPALGEYVLSVPDADGRRTITAPAGRVYGVGAATLTFECTVRADAAGKSASSSLANIAEATGTRPDPERPGSELPENPEPSDPATPPKSPTVAPADPQVKISKSVENTTSPDAKVTRVGDVLRYTVALANEGAANSCLQSAVVSDPLPAGLEPVPGSIKMTLADGSETPVGDAAYDKASRTLAVTAGDLWGGERVTLVFEATVGEAALGANNANIALAHGTVPSKGPGGTPGDPAPGQPTTPPSGDPVAFTPPATPPVMVGEDPAEGDVKVSKAAENLTSDDGKTRVGDEIRYTVTLRNDGAGTAWMDAVVKDVVPKGLEPAAGTIKVMLPNGSEATVADTAYEVATRTLAVAVGHLYGGQEATVTFIAIVTEDAVGTDIGNVAAAVGDLPSKWDPDAEHPEPGKPFSPPEGWPDYEKDRPKVESPKAYPPGGENVTAEKLAQTEGETDDKSTDSKKSKAKPIAGTKLAQTGDAALAAALPLAAAALVAAGALLLGRRRLNRR